MLKFQRKNVLDSKQSLSSESSDEGLDHLKLFKHKNKTIKELYLKRLEYILQSYEGINLQPIDRKLFKGLKKKVV